jgi:serine/threonine protein kinase
LSEDAKDICCRLLNKDPAHRLGSYSAGIKDIKEHPWFDSIDWNTLYNKTIQPPYKP